MINYTMAREHFIDMGEQVHKHIYDINLAWGQFLDFYSDLNNARKAHEDSFVEKQYIGEEIVEPDEMQLADSDLIDDAFNNHEEDMNNRNFFNAFDDGFDDVLSNHNRRSSSVAGTANMLAELQQEVNREESKQPASKLINTAQEESKNEEAPASENQQIIEESGNQ